MRLGIFGGAICVLLVTSVVGQSGEQPADTKNGSLAKAGATPDLNAAAKAFVGLLEQEKYAEAVQQFDATMRQALPKEKLQSAWRATVQAYGEFQKCDNGRVNHVDKFDVVDIPCELKNSNVIIRISFNPQREISGLFFIPSGDRKASSDDGPEVQLETPTGTLFGTLDLPEGKGPWTIALIIAGSGPTDRDGNQPFMKNDSLRLLGKALAAHGVAALRYDKRAIAKSVAAGPAEEKLRLETYVDDAAAWIKQLRGDHRFNQVVILGHSEGSLIGTLAAQHQPIDAFVSLEGAGRHTATLLRDQLKRNLPDEQFKQASHIIDELLAGRKVDNVPAELMVLFRPSVQPYLMTWLTRDPAKELATVNVPVLIVQGTTDLQVSLDDAKLLESSNKSARLVTIEDMNHVLKRVPGKSLVEQAPAYSDPSLPLAPHLVDEIVSFLQSVKPAARPADSR